MAEYDYSNPTVSYRVFDGRASRDTTIHGRDLSGPIGSPDAAIGAALAARATHPDACVIQFTRYF